MILTVTMNPSVDISYQLEKLQGNGVNRCENYVKTAGGKGLNVTRVIHQMAEDVIATGLLGGKLGEEIQSELTEGTIRHDFSIIEGQTRNCIAILHDNGKQTEILESGPSVDPQELHEFLKKFVALAKQSEVITVSGSLPNGVDKSFYVELLKAVSELKVKVLLDTSNASLYEVLASEHKPYAIKPNMEEIKALMGIQEELTESQLINLLKKPLFSGIPLILVSLGAEGAIVKTRDRFYRVTIPKIEVVNPVGSGDSTVAGLAIGLAKAIPMVDVLKTAMTLGMLNAMEQTTGCVNPANFDTCFSQVMVCER